MEHSWRIMLAVIFGEVRRSDMNNLLRGDNLPDDVILADRKEGQIGKSNYDGGT
jgi:hypothetical protein